MRSERWWQNASVIEELLEKPASFEFIQAARLLRHMPYADKSKHWAANFQFNSSLKLNFPQSEIEALHLDDHKAHLTNLMVGLTGMQGMLPYSYTNKIKLSGHKQQKEALHFLNLFNHKLTAQYVDASLHYNLPIRYEIDSENHYIDILHALNGYVKNQHQHADLDDYFAEFSGLMQGQTNTVYALKTILSCIFDAEIAIQEFIPAQFSLSAEQRTCLGAAQASRLGLNTFCGESVRQMDDKIEITIGPLNRQDYAGFLPRQAMSEKLKKIISTWCSPTLAVDVRLILKKEYIHSARLSADVAAGLGHGAFLSPQKTIDNAETCYALIGNLS